MKMMDVPILRVYESILLHFTGAVLRAPPRLKSWICEELMVLGGDSTPHKKVLPCR